MKFLPIPLITICLFFFSNTYSQDHSIQLRSGSFTPAKNISQDFITEYNRTSQRINGRSFSVIQFDDIPSPSLHQELKRAGIELMEYIPNHSYTTAISKALDISLLQRAKARAIFQLSPEQKMHPNLVKKIYPSWSTRTAGMIELWISFPKILSFEEVRLLLQQNNITITTTYYKAYKVIGILVARDRIHEIASYPFIDYVEPAPHGDQILNKLSRNNSKANVLNAPITAGGYALNGEGIVIGVGDDADPKNHFDFSERLINFGPAAHAFHGTHVHGTVGGGGLLNMDHRGYASKSIMITQFLSDIIKNSATYVNDYGMVITNNSYGDVVDDCAYAGTYDLLSRILDLQSISLPNLQHVYAAGNDGANTCPPYPASFQTVLGGYQSSKNIIAVGAAERNGSISFFSSRGPVNDGRIKPEITVDGSGVISSTPGNIYGSSSGTSMASPGVAGGIALLYQQYRTLNAGATPKSGLMKALLCNGATDAGNTGPDFTYGFGNMNLLRSANMLGNNRYFISTITNLGLNTHTIVIPAATAELKVMLCWQDEAGVVYSSRTLVNDLDLELITPSSTTLFPWKLDTLPANVNSLAVTGADHINNIEQVSVTNPASGSYTINVKGTLIPNAPHEYFVVYDLIPTETKLTYPIGGEGLVPGESVVIEWESYGNPANTFTVEYSIDNGTNWVDINNAVPANERQLLWTVPSVATSQALIRVTRNGTSFISSSLTFTILGLPVVTLAPTQCEGYFAFNWTAIPGATDYEIFTLVGSEMVSVGTTVLTSHTFSGLSPSRYYWAAVRPRIGGIAGKRSVAIPRLPNTGTCAGSISDNDLKMDSITAPVYGRIGTSTQLSPATSISARIKNLDDANATSFSMRYSINGGAFVTEPVVTTIAPGATYTHTFATSANMSAAGEYILRVEVINSGGVDVVVINNALTDTIRHIINNIVTLPFNDDLETLSEEKYYRPFYGLRGNARYDFTNTMSLGRLSTSLTSVIPFSGINAFSLDLDGFDGAGNTNFIYGTYNLTGLDANARDIRLDFQLKTHGDSISNSNNRVWVRGDDSQPWLPAFLYSSNGNEPGIYKKTPSIEVSDLLIAAVQNFSSSFQVRWGQFGVQRIRDNEEGQGQSFDNIRLYEAIDDVAMISIDTPIVNSCGLNSTVPVRITIRNTSPNTLNNIPVRLIVDGITVATETVVINPSGLAPNTNYQYTFTATANLSSIGTHTVQVLVMYPTDNFPDNDSLTVTLVNSPLITSFPYLENFESGNGNWYSGGKNNSWQYGSPASLKILSAASGTKAWKTSLVGAYNNNELSYLYSPCFNVTGMTSPTLSMNIALDLEDCGAGFCDGAYVEYSGDGKTWTRLGASGAGFNWYNKNYTNNNLWSVQDYTNWHVATIPLPTGISNLRLRIVMASDMFVTWEGIGVDDIHIYDNTMGIYDGVTMATPVNQNITGSTNWIDFTKDGKLVASIQPNNQNMGSTNVQAYINTTGVRNDGKQYYHDRNITIKPANISLSDSAIVRFYFLDVETENLINATGCGSCTKPSDVTELGVTKYNDTDDNVENGTIADNLNGVYSFHSADWNYKIPFDKGYYVEFRVKDFSEFWLNNGWFNRLTALPVDLLSFTARKQNEKDVLAEWVTGSEQNVNRFEIEVARSNADYQNRRFVKLGEIFSAGNSTTQRRYSFTDTEPGKSGARYYRLRIVDNDGTFVYSPVRPVIFSNDIQWQVYPNPSKGTFHFIYQANMGETLVVKLYDLNGRVIQQDKLTGTGFIQKLPVLLEKYSSGIYLLNVKAGDKEQSFRLVKQ